MWKEPYDKIKTIAPDTTFIERIDIFNITEPNTWLYTDDSAETIKEWSQEMIQLFMVQSHHENISVTVVLQHFFHQSKCMRTLALNCTYYIIYRVVHDLSSLTALNKKIYHGLLKFLLSACSQAANEPYGYNLLDLNQSTSEEKRHLLYALGMSKPWPRKAMLKYCVNKEFVNLLSVKFNC